MKKYDAAVIGGGPAGSFTALLLADAGLSVCLFERKKFPREVLCGEFLSHEVSALLKQHGLFEKFLELNPSRIKSFRLFSSEGNKIHADLSFQAYGLKRSTLDKFLLEQACKKGAIIYQPINIRSVEKDKEFFILDSDDALQVKSEYVIGAYGKNSPLDKQLNRGFKGQTSPFNGVKVHIDFRLLRNFDPGEIHIYTAPGLYCGVNKVNENSAALCFLERRSGGDPPVRVKFRLLSEKNKYFRNIISPASKEAILNAKIYGTGNIYFGRKEPVVSDILMAGDSAGMIAPLAGDGIGMAMESAQIIADMILKSRRGKINRTEIPFLYESLREQTFGRRIRTAMIIQKIIFNKYLLNPGLKLLNFYPRLTSKLIDYTRN